MQEQEDYSISNTYKILIRQTVHKYTEKGKVEIRNGTFRGNIERGVYELNV
jgi:hypothetical protein